MYTHHRPCQITSRSRKSVSRTARASAYVYRYATNAIDGALEVALTVPCTLLVALAAEATDAATAG